MTDLLRPSFSTATTAAPTRSRYSQYSYSAAEEPSSSKFSPFKSLKKFVSNAFASKSKKNKRKQPAFKRNDTTTSYHSTMSGASSFTGSIVDQLFEPTYRLVPVPSTSEAPPSTRGLSLSFLPTTKLSPASSAVSAGNQQRALGFASAPVTPAASRGDRGIEWNTNNTTNMSTASIVVPKIQLSSPPGDVEVQTQAGGTETPKAANGGENKGENDGSALAPGKGADNNDDSAVDPKEKPADGSKDSDSDANLANSDVEEEEEEEERFNPGYKEWKRQRRLWTKGGSKVPPQPSVLTDVPDSMYPRIYKCLVQQARPLRQPMNLADAIKVIKAGWVDDGQWEAAAQATAAAVIASQPKPRPRPSYGVNLPEMA